LPATRHLKGKEVRRLIKEFTQQYPASSSILNSASNFEEIVVDDSAIVFVDGRSLILRTQGLLLPSLRFDELVDTLPRVIVDMGAVAHLVNGADIMRPGIREIKGTFAKGGVTVIVDEKFGKAIALGIADMDSGVMQSVIKGKVISNVHYVGDEIWKTFSAPKPR
jgi:PUA-domain protein